MVSQPPEITGFSRILSGSSDPTTHLLTAFLVVAGTLWLLARLVQSTIRASKLPPGPRGLPLVGDVLHIADQEWIASPQRRDDYGENSWSSMPRKKKYELIHRSGDMMYINALGKGTLIINSQRVAVDLLEKRSKIYSDRPRFISAGEFLTKNMAFGFTPYGYLCAIY